MPRERRLDDSRSGVRQRAFSVYRKAGLGSGSELAAFLLEDLLLPPEQREEGGVRS